MPPKRVATAPAESLPAKLVERVLPKLNTDQLADAIAVKLSDQILTSLQVDKIVSSLLERYGSEVEEAITSAVIARM